MGLSFQIFTSKFYWFASTKGLVTHTHTHIFQTSKLFKNNPTSASISPYDWLDVLQQWVGSWLSTTSVGLCAQPSVTPWMPSRKCAPSSPCEDLLQLSSLWRRAFQCGCPERVWLQILDHKDSSVRRQFQWKLPKVRFVDWNVINFLRCENHWQNSTRFQSTRERAKMPET